MFHFKPQTLLQTSLVLAFYLGIAVPQSAIAKDPFPMHQGMHEWNVANGKVVLVVGTYQDTTTFKRSYNFYFVAKNDDAWNQVLFITKPKNTDFTWTSASGGDVTLSDGIVSVQGKEVFFIYAAKHGGKEWTEASDAKVTWFKFIESNNDHPDDPPYTLRPIFTRNYSKKKNLKVEEILLKELTLKPRK